jgi:hypothetical protein
VQLAGSTKLAKQKLSSLHSTVPKRNWKKGAGKGSELMSAAGLMALWDDQIKAPA